MAKEIMTFEQLPKAVSELTNQVMELRDIVAALKPAVPDEKHRIVEIDEACKITRKAKPIIYALSFLYTYHLKTTLDTEQQFDRRNRSIIIRVLIHC